MLNTSFTPGAPIWLDLGSSDVDTANTFYGGLFGWKAVSAGPDTGGYGFFELDGRMVGGFGPLMEPGATDSWTPYFATTDVEATANSSEQAGGTTRLAPTDVMTFGRMAQLSDPAGARFAVWQPGDTTGFQVVNEPGSLSWVELHTTDGPAASAFYRTVLGWEIEEMPIGGGMVYLVASPTGRSDGFGGIMAMADVPTVLWRPYFEVAECDATVAEAERLGGSVLMAAQTMPDVGRMAELADPQGARFSVITSAMPQS